MEKFKEFLKTEKRKILLAATPAMVAVMAVVPAFAADELPTFDLATTMTTAVTTLVGNLLTMIAAIFPVTITLLAASIGVSYGVKFIKNMFSKT